MSLGAKIKANPKIKRIVLWMLMPTNRYVPRLWVSWFVNPFVHKKGKGAIIRRRARLDVFPFNGFHLGAKSLIEDFTTINNGVGDVSIGERTVVGLSDVIIGPVEIGNNVMLAQHVVISGLNHGYERVDVPPKEQDTERKLITISDDVWIGANSVVAAGVTIGKHCVIGAGSVVTKDVPDFSVAVGNPAKVIKRFNHTTGCWERI